MRATTTMFVSGAACIAALIAAGAVSAAPPGPHEKPVHGDSDLAPPGDDLSHAKGKIDAEIRPADAVHPESSRLRIDLKGLVAGDEYTLWGDDPATPADPALVQFGTLTADDKGHARLELDTAHGDALPFSASLVDLGGLAAEVHADAAVVLAGLFPVPTSPPPHPPHARGRGVLDAPDGAEFADARGRIDAAVKPAHGHDAESSRLRIQLHHLGANAEYTLWADDPSTPADPALVQFGTATTNGGGNGKFDADTHKGDALPFDAALADLGGSAVEVRDAGGVVVLTGTFPETDPAAPHEPALKGHSDLDPPVAAPHPEPKGKIKAESRPAHGHDDASSRLRIELSGLAAATEYTLWGDDPATPADPALVQFGTVTTDAGGHARLDLDTGHGDTLPFGATLADLAGLAVEVHSGADVVLVGTFPTLD